MAAIAWALVVLGCIAAGTFLAVNGHWVFATIVILVGCCASASSK